MEKEGVKPEEPRRDAVIDRGPDTGVIFDDPDDPRVMEWRFGRAQVRVPVVLIMVRV